MSNINNEPHNSTKRYTNEFKKQIVELVRNGKTKTDVEKEYNISRSTVSKWCTDFNNTGSFKAKDNRTDEENEMLRLKKENIELKMEVDILKQAALIMGRK